MAREDAALARHIGTVLPTLGEEIEAGDAVDALLKHPGFPVVRALIDEEIATINAQMERSTSPMDQAEYALRHGRIGGLRGFETAAETILARSEKRLQEQQAQHEGDAEPSPER